MLARLIFQRLFEPCSSGAHNDDFKNSWGSHTEKQIELISISCCKQWKNYNKSHHICPCVRLNSQRAFLDLVSKNLRSNSKTSHRCYSPFHKTLNCNPMDISAASSFSDIKKPLWTLRYLLCLIECLKPEHTCKYTMYQMHLFLILKPVMPMFTNVINPNEKSFVQIMQ